MNPLHALAGLARAEASAGIPGAAGDVFALAFLACAFELEARRWGEEHGVEIVGYGLATRPACIAHG